MIPFKLNEPYLAFFCGRPRSGKSYLSSFLILHCLDNFDFNIYTDIQGIKPDNKRLFRININKFLSLWSEELNAKNADLYKDSHDEYFRNKFEVEGYLNALIVLDEVQSYLDVENPIWKRIFSYYGHYDMKIVLITQDLPLVHKKYKSTVDKFIWAVSSGNRLFGKNFQYRWFDNHMMRNGTYYNDLITDFKIPMKKEVFEFYNSGSKVRKKSHLHTIFKGFYLPFLIMIVTGFILYYNIKPDPKKDNNSSVVSNTRLNITKKQISSLRSSPSSVVDDDSTILFLRSAVLGDNVLYLYSDSCPGVHFPFSMFSFFKYQFFVNDTSFLFRVPISFKNSILGVCNEKNNNSSSINLP